MRYHELLEYTKFSNDGHTFDYDDYNHPGMVAQLKAKPRDLGPHQGKELNMLLSGVKPAALTYDLAPFLPAIEAGQLIYQQCINRANATSYVVALPGQEARIKRIIALLIEPNGTDNPVYHVRLGRLLGYTKDQIRAFLNK